MIASHFYPSEGPNSGVLSWGYREFEASEHEGTESIVRGCTAGPLRF